MRARHRSGERESRQLRRRDVVARSQSRRDGRIAATATIGATTLIEPTAIPRRTRPARRFRRGRLRPPTAQTARWRVPAIATAIAIPISPEPAPGDGPRATAPSWLFRPPRKSPRPHAMLAPSAQTLRSRATPELVWWPRRRRAGSRGRGTASSPCVRHVRRGWTPRRDDLGDPPRRARRRAPRSTDPSWTCPSNRPSSVGPKAGPGRLDRPPRRRAAARRTSRSPRSLIHLAVSRDRVAKPRCARAGRPAYTWCDSGLAGNSRSRARSDLSARSGDELFMPAWEISPPRNSRSRPSSSGSRRIAASLGDVRSFGMLDGANVESVRRSRNLSTRPSTRRRRPRRSASPALDVVPDSGLDLPAPVESSSAR